MRLSWKLFHSEAIISLVDSRPPIATMARSNPWPLATTSIDSCSNPGGQCPSKMNYLNAFLQKSSMAFSGGKGCILWIITIENSLLFCRHSLNLAMSDITLKVLISLGAVCPHCFIVLCYHLFQKPFHVVWLRYCDPNMTIKMFFHSMVVKSFLSKSGLAKTAMPTIEIVESLDEPSTNQAFILSLVINPHNFSFPSEMGCQSRVMPCNILCIAAWSLLFEFVSIIFLLDLAE